MSNHARSLANRDDLRKAGRWNRGGRADDASQSRLRAPSPCQSKASSLPPRRGGRSGRVVPGCVGAWVRGWECGGPCGGCAEIDHLSCGSPRMDQCTCPCPCRRPRAVKPPNNPRTSSLRTHGERHWERMGESLHSVDSIPGEYQMASEMLASIVHGREGRVLRRVGST
jgi:hypothetical protein